MARLVADKASTISEFVEIETARGKNKNKENYSVIISTK